MANNSMQKIKIAYKVKNALIENLLLKDNIEELQEQTMFSKLSFKKKEYADIYFHQGKIDKKVLENFEFSKLIVVTSNSIKKTLINEFDIDESKIEVFYPTFEPNDISLEDAKKKFFEELNISKNYKIIFLTSNNLKNAGIKEFINAILNLNNSNFKVIIASNKEQITTLKFQISKYKFEDRVILYEDFEDIDLLFAISDIFVLPTSSQLFSLNILKAMYYENAVFTTIQNDSSELIDVFSTMSSPNDASITFKIDALLNNSEELNNIQKRNHLISKELVLSKILIKLNKLLV